jgi:hypothetical protein
VIQIEPSFFGYPWCQPRTNAKSLSTQIRTHLEYCSPRYEQRTTRNASLYCERIGSRSSSYESEQDCQSAKMTATASGSSSTGARGSGSHRATEPGAARYSIVSRSPE